MFVTLVIKDFVRFFVSFTKTNLGEFIRKIEKKNDKNHAPFSEIYPFIEKRT